MHKRKRTAQRKSLPRLAWAKSRPLLHLRPPTPRGLMMSHRRRLPLPQLRHQLPQLHHLHPHCAKRLHLRCLPIGEPHKCALCSRCNRSAARMTKACKDFQIQLAPIAQ